MARNRNRVRRSNRGSIYARPIPEPANFVEFDLELSNSSNEISHTDISSALGAVVTVGSIKKYRISSLVFEPIQSPVSIVTAEVQMGITGNEYLYAQANKPLRIRLGKDYGDDGMWLVVDGAAITADALPGSTAPADAFLTLNVPAAVTTWSTTVHCRVAWQDPT